MGNFTFWLSFLLSQFAERNLKLNANVPTLTRDWLNFGLSMYLEHAFRLRPLLGEITLLFNLNRYLDRTFAQRKSSQKVKSPNGAANRGEHRGPGTQLTPSANIEYIEILK